MENSIKLTEPATTQTKNTKRTQTFKSIWKSSLFCCFVLRFEYFFLFSKKGLYVCYSLNSVKLKYEKLKKMRVEKRRSKRDGERKCAYVCMGERRRERESEKEIEIRENENGLRSIKRLFCFVHQKVLKIGSKY